jgi:D-lactate dehydrogenase (cytochrome)
MAIATSTIDQFADDLAAALAPERVSRAEAVRAQHGGGETLLNAVPPDLVATPHTTDEVVALVNLAREYHVPVIPHGAGSSLEGHLAAVHGGVSVDMREMSRILRLELEDLDVTVEAGVSRLQLDEHIRPHGVFFPVDPGADATLGGMAGTSATGTTTVRYGAMRENVRSLTVVTAQGKVIRTASRAAKTSAGYDLTRLFVGSEGTLGVITELTLRVYGIPEAIAAAVCVFPSVDAAVQTAIATVQMGIPIARVEMLDAEQMRGMSLVSDLDYEAAPTLFLEFHGSEAAVTEQAKEVGEIATEFGGNDFVWSLEQEERTRLWSARHLAWEAAKALRPGCEGLSTDICVPISRLAECIQAAREDIDASGLQAAIVGHVGDGHYHVVFVLDPNDPDEMRRALDVHERMVHKSISVEGTCSGEHGVGQGKAKFLELEHGVEGVEVMRAVKHSLDPDGIMNPGKIIDAPAPTYGHSV